MGSTSSEKLKNVEIFYDIDGTSGTISFKGNIDEDFKYDGILQKQLKDFKIDFSGVTLLNSCGIREWVGLVEKLGSNAKISYINTPQIVIKQMNIVKGFLTSNAKVESFHAPYFCDECEHEDSKLLTINDVKGMKAPTFKCAKCEAEMELDAIEKQYFHFLSIQGS